jgi:hypothetical protein
LLPALALEVKMSNATSRTALWRLRIPALSAVGRRPLTRVLGIHSFTTLFPSI